MEMQSALSGLVAGAVGTAAMTLSEKIEQAVTSRPNSYVPAHTLERLIGAPEKPDDERLAMNWAMHWRQGILMGAARGVLAEHGLRGAKGSLLFLALRMLNDQTLENATKVGSPPWTWPTDELVVDLLHKSVYAFVTGAVADLLVDGLNGSVEEPDLETIPADDLIF